MAAVKTLHLVFKYYKMYWYCDVNHRTYKQGHTSTMVQAGLMEPPPPPWVFVMLQYFEKISSLVESL